MIDGLSCLPCGDSAVLVTFGEEVDRAIMARAHSLAKAVSGAGVPGVRLAVVGRSSVLVHYDSLLASFEDIERLVRDLTVRGIELRPVEGRLRELPTVYGGRFGPDLRHVAEARGLTEGEVVRLQTSASYTAVFMGFAPGLAQLMGLPEALAMDRKRSPEPVAEGAIVIARGVVPMSVASPSGWWCIGRTSVRLFRPLEADITYLLPGDEVRFVPISEVEYERSLARSSVVE